MGIKEEFLFSKPRVSQRGIRSKVKY